jgi:hypothetical protein
MKFECMDCANEDQVKFAKTPKAVICLVCYEKKVRMIPENQAEKAQVEIINHMTRPTGGNNRKWTNAYREISRKAEFLEELPNKNQEQEYFAKGFRSAVDYFNKVANE